MASTQTSPFGCVGILEFVRRISISMFATVALLAGQNFKVDDVKVVGDLVYGQTSGTVDCSGVPSYCAFVFNGQGDDRVEVEVSSAEGKAFVAIADGALAELTTGTNQWYFHCPEKTRTPRHTTSSFAIARVNLGASSLR